jgi:hypothetical protein
MKKARDEIIASNPIYEGENWTSLGIEHLHEVCREAIEKCQPSSLPLAQWFQNLRSATPIQKKEERKWLLDGLDLWFTKKWNNKRTADVKKAESPRKSKPHNCERCGHSLACPVCDDDCVDVFRLDHAFIWLRIVQKDEEWRAFGRAAN